VAEALLRLRPTMLSDLDFVTEVETDQHNLPFISPWERVQHEGALRFPDFRHFIVEAGPMARAMVLSSCKAAATRTSSVELKRLVLQTKGQGLGRRCVRLLKRMAYRDLHAHRFWLDVKLAQHAGAGALRQRGLCRRRPAARKRAHQHRHGRRL
jgi:diamine N-acetyltransferase